MVVVKAMLPPLLALSILIGSTATISAAGFRTRQEVFWFGTTITNRAIITQERADECHVAGEELPAEFDTDGNWGFSSEGFQLSLRFQKPVFLSGEPAIASLIVRNVSGGKLADTIALPDRTEFIVTNEKQEQLNRIDIFRSKPTEAEERRRATFKTFGLDLEADEQWKFKMVLTDMYDLRAPGTYELRAIRNVRKLDGTGFGQVMSGTARIRVVASATSSVAAMREASLSNPQGAAPGSTTAANGRTASIAATDLSGANGNAQSSRTAAPARTVESEPAAPSPSNGADRVGSTAGNVKRFAPILLLLAAALLAFFFVRRARRRA